MALKPYRSLEVQALRGVKGLRLEACGAVNLLVGGNNSGKTTALEALLLLAAPTRVATWEAAVDLRRTWPLADAKFSGASVERLQALSWLFPRHGNVLEAIEIRAVRGEGEERLSAQAEWVQGFPPKKPDQSEWELVESSRRVDLGPLYDGAETGLEIKIRATEGDRAFRMMLWNQVGRRLPDRRPQSVAFASPISHRSDGFLASSVGRIIRSDRLGEAISLLQGIDPHIQDLMIVHAEEADPSSTLRQDSRPTLHVRHALSGLVPVHAMGDGTRRAIHLASVLVDLPKGGILLLDELEVGMHSTVLQSVFRWLISASRTTEVQLFATTHSLEAIDTMLAAVPDEDVVLYRVEADQVKRLAGDSLRRIRAELGAEVR